jgi:hypothetical protein
MSSRRANKNANRAESAIPVRTYRDVVVAVFDELKQAEHALRPFRGGALNCDELGLAVCTDALIVQEDVFARHDAADRGLGTVMSELGVPEQEAREYEREFEFGRTIVAVKCADRPADAANMLMRARSS